MIPASGADAEDRRERLAMFFPQARSAVLAQLVMAAFIAALALFSLDRAHAPEILIWFVLLLLISLFRLKIIAHDRRRLPQSDDRQAVAMEVRLSRLAGLSGLAWGLVTWFAWQENQLLFDTLVVAIIFGMAGSGTSTLAALPRAFPWFAWPAVLPNVVKALSFGDAIYATVAVLMVVGVLLLMHFNQRAHQMISESIRLRRENAHLVEQLRREKAAVEEAAHIKTLFLAGVTHDLRHPLHALNLFLGYLQSRPDDLGKALPGMQQAISGMGHQLSRLLEMARLESGAVQVNRSRVDLLEQLSAACEATFPLARAKGLRLRWRASPGVEQETDAQMFRSVIDNLLSNAVRYTTRGGVLLGLRRSRDAWRIEVWDTGPGICPEHIPLLFDPYRRFDDRTESGEQGYGLGLALARKQCELLGYRLQVNSRPGKGSVFRVLVPVAA